MPQLPPNVNYLVVYNQTDRELSVNGTFGSDLSSVVKGQTIPPNQSVGIAQYNNGCFSGDCWDWVYLWNPTDNLLYQIYVEYSQLAWTLRFGFWSSSATHSNPDPCPFPPGYWSAEQNGGICTYTLSQIPLDNPCGNNLGNQS